MTDACCFILHLAQSSQSSFIGHFCGMTENNLWTETSEHLFTDRLSLLTTTTSVDWHFLKGDEFFYPRSLPLSFKANLARNCWETHLLFDVISSPIRIFSYTVLMNELFDMATPPYQSLKKSDLLCTSCLGDFLLEHLHLWWLEQKRTS